MMTAPAFPRALPCPARLPGQLGYRATLPLWLLACALVVGMWLFANPTWAQSAGSPRGDEVAPPEVLRTPDERMPEPLPGEATTPAPAGEAASEPSSDPAPAPASAPAPTPAAEPPRPPTLENASRPNAPPGGAPPTAGSLAAPSDASATALARDEAAAAPAPPPDAASGTPAAPALAPTSGAPLPASERGALAFAYAPDWAVVALGAGLAAADLGFPRAPLATLIGPAVDPHTYDPSPLSDARLAGLVDRPMRQESVPGWALAVGGASVLASASLLDGAARRDWQRSQAFVLGGLASTFLTANATGLLKWTTGRLRPDFGERYARAACEGIIATAEPLDCAPYADGFQLGEAGYLEGFQSFPSGHASLSFAWATYVSLYLVNEWILGPRASGPSASMAALGVGALYAGAAFVAASRVGDHRHHLEDVAVGAALGSALGLASWVWYFDPRGEVRSREWQWSGFFQGGGGGVQVARSF